MQLTIPRQRILNKINVCQCGCHGSDPWHRSWYTRTVRVTSADALEGWVKLPYSTEHVRVTRARATWRHWTVDRSSINY